MNTAALVRLWTLALKQSVRLGVISGDTPAIIPETDDVRLSFGDGTRSWDVRTYGGSVLDYMEWDASASKMTYAGAAILDVPAGQLQLGSTAIDATAAELNRACDVSARIVNTTATQLAVTVTQHEGKIIKISSTSPIAVTLPAASGSGAKFEMVVNVVATGTPHTITCNGTDVYAGSTMIAQTDTAQVNGFIATATDNTISLNGTTKGGLVGDKIQLVDIAANKWALRIEGAASGTVATPLSHV